MDDRINSCKVLLVDDVEMNLVILSEIIKSIGHIPLKATSVKDARDILAEDVPDIILLDISMPDMNGIDFCALLKQDVYTRDIPVIFISALDSAEDLSKAFDVGAVDYIFKPFDPTNITIRVNTHLKLAKMQSELEEANKRLNIVIKKQMNYNRNLSKEIYRLVSELASERDTYRTYNGMNESQLARTLALAMQFSEPFEDVITDSFLDNMEIAATIHDLGTIKLPDSVALKQGKLEPEEEKLMQKHTIYGYEKMEKISGQYADDDLLKVIKNVILHHHENYDGTGFPNGLKGEAIPICARIMRVVDTYEALVNDRCYHKAVSYDEAIAILKEGAGKQFDPDIVGIFVKIQKKIRID